MNMNTTNVKAMSNLSTLDKQRGQSDQGYSNKRGVGEVSEKRNHPKMSLQCMKTQICKFNLLGVCNKGSACAFAHSEEDLKARPDLSRTRLCQVLLQTGRCNVKNCTFAHCKEELRATDSCHKTKMCKFWQVGHCTLGDNCRFAHSADELKEAAEVTTTPQQQDQLYNISLSQQRQQLQQQQVLKQQMHSIQWQQHQHQQPSRKENYNGCAPHDYSGFDTLPAQAPYPVPMQHLIMNGGAELFGAHALPRMVQERCGPGSPLQQSQDNSLQEGQKRNPRSNCSSKNAGIRNLEKIELASSISIQPACEPQDSGSFSTMSDCFGSDVEFAPWDSSDPDSSGTRTPDFPPNYGEGQEPVRVMPNMWQLPVLLVPVQQAIIEDDTGDTIDCYTGDVEIMQAPLADETFETHPLGSVDEIWGANTDYQVKNTFISVKDVPACRPLRCVRSAAGRLTEIENLS